MGISVDIVLPCYNPPAGWATNLVRSVARLQELLPNLQPQVLVVNDGSARGVSAEDLALLREKLPGFEYLTYAPNRGKGFALRYGIEHARHELCLFTDIDFPYEETSVVAVLEALVA